MLTLKVINLFAGPGAGKSTLAAGLFNLMKVTGENVELVTEYAKDLTYAKDYGTLGNQLMILAQQDQRLRRLEGQVEWAITDSPLPLGLAYITREYEPWLEETIWGAFDRYENYYVYVDRGAIKYVPGGRNQTEKQARMLDNSVGHIFDRAVNEDVDFSMEVSALDPEAAYRIYEFVKDGE